MRIAIPLAAGQLCMHFGHCEQFALVDVDEAAQKGQGTTLLTPPPHEPGLLPRWLHEQGADVVIAGGMGQRRSNCSPKAASECWSAPAGTPEELVAAFLDGSLKSGQNTCDH